MKGFVSIIAVMAVFVLAVIMLSATSITPKNSSFKESFLDTKLFLGKYETLLNQKMQDFDWTLGEQEITDEIILVSEEIMPKIRPPQTQCYEISPQIENDYFVFHLSCLTKIISGGKTLFENSYTKKIYVKNYNTTESTP